MTCGVYCLYFECDDGQYYIGESSNIEKRYKEHCNNLVRGSHINYKLSNAYSRYGMPIMEVVEATDEADLKRREVFWIREFNSFYSGMNLTIGGDGCGYGDRHPSSIYTEETYVEILHLLANTNKSAVDISKQLNISYNVVTQISIGQTHAYLQDRFPDLYKKMLAKVGSRAVGSKSSISDDILKNIVSLLIADMPYKNIAEIVGVPITTIKSIAIGSAHKNLMYKIPEEYASLLDKQSKRKYTNITRPKLQAPDGKILDVGNNVSAFCRDNDLDQRAISAVLLGTRKIHRGWALYNELDRSK